jgi:hypothetical protein
MLMDRDYQNGLPQKGYEIVRLPPRLTIGPNVLGYNTKPSIAAFMPDPVILVGPGKLFGLETFSSESSSWTTVRGPGRRSVAPELEGGRASARQATGIHASCPNCGSGDPQRA